MSLDLTAAELVYSGNEFPSLSRKDDPVKISVLKNKQTNKQTNKQKTGGAWVAQSVTCPTSARVMTSRSMSSSPTSSCVLTAQSLEPASDSVSLSLPLPRLAQSVSQSVCLSVSLSLSLSPKKLNVGKKKKKKKQKGMANL